MRVKEISSPQNPIIKDLALLLTKSRARRDRGLFLVEGLREVERALRSGYDFESILYRPDLISMNDVQQHLGQATSKLDSIQHIQCSSKAFAKVAYRVDVPNIVGVAKRIKRDHLDAITQIQASSHSPFILVLEGIEKPGNLGAILRSANAFGVDLVILVNCTAEVEHPNTIRNSLGAALAIPIVATSLEECHHTLSIHNIPIYVTHLNADSISPSELSLDQASAIVLGSEAAGASDLWLKYGAQATLIPMVSDRIVDSLNVSVATAILLYEVNRQRRSS